MHKSYVELIGLSKRFGTVAAVSDVSLAIPEGKVTTLLGPSGCGKTTILRLIAGFIQPDAGDIRIKDRRVNDIPPQRRSTVVVFQDYALFPHLSVFENVAYGLRRRGVDRAEITRRVRDMLVFLGLPEQGAQSPLQLSGGQQQRVALARALVVEPDVLLLDEPLSNLDAKLRVRVRTELKEIQQTLGKTTILVTHDQEEALSISDHIAIFDAGRVRQIGTPYEVYSRPIDQFTADFVGIANFVPATVRSGGAGSVMLESALGQLTPNTTGLSPGQLVTIVLRPTALRLFSTPQAGYIKAKVRSASFLGGVRRYVVQVGEFRLIVDQPATEFEASEGNVWLSVDQRAGFHVLSSAHE